MAVSNFHFPGKNMCLSSESLSLQHAVGCGGRSGQLGQTRAALGWMRSGPYGRKVASWSSVRAPGAPQRRAADSTSLGIVVFRGKTARDARLAEILEIGGGRAAQAKERIFCTPGRLSRKGGPGSSHSQTQPLSIVLVHPSWWTALSSGATSSRRGWPGLGHVRAKIPTK